VSPRITRITRILRRKKKKRPVKKDTQDPKGGKKRPVKKDTQDPKGGNYKLQSPRRGRPLRGVLHPLRGKFEARGFEAQKSETMGRPSDMFKTPFTPFRGNSKQ
jgi:hypothetical protein